MSEAPGLDPQPSSVLAPPEIVAVLDRLVDGIMVLGRDWRVHYINQPAAEMLGRPAAELRGRSILDSFPEAVGHPLQLGFAEAIRSGEPMRMVEHYEPLGRWFEARAYPHDDKVVNLFRDVTPEHEIELELREQVRQFAEAERIVKFGTWRWDVDAGRVHWSDELHRIYGLRPGEFAGTAEAFSAALHPDDRDRVWDEISTAMETLSPFVFEERIERPDGEVRTLISKGRVIPGSDGKAQALVGVCHDVTSRVRTEQALGESERRMHAIIDNTPSLITVKDLDGSYLMANAEAARITGIPSEQMVGMHCTEVFPAAIGSRQRAIDRQAASEGEAVYDEVGLRIEGEDRTYLSVTFPLPDEDGVPAETCSIATDVTERRERESEQRERREWRERIETAVAEDRILVYAQPIIDLASGKETSRELLARLQVPGEPTKTLPPAAFLPAAERFDLIQQIDVWMVRQAIAIPSQVPLDVNISALTMCDGEARAEIEGLLRAAPEAAERLVFEVTETASAFQLEAAHDFAAAVTDLGCRLALDDFGVGFGSFTYLRTLPLSFIKIDLSFVQGATSSTDDRRVIRGIIGIAREFGLRTIAEGVEDGPTLELLRELGADLVQGHLLGHPAPLAEAGV
jgi:PAS domain S-box-containing protein